MNLFYERLSCISFAWRIDTMRIINTAKYLTVSLVQSNTKRGPEFDTSCCKCAIRDKQGAEQSNTSPLLKYDIVSRLHVSA